MPPASLDLIARQVLDGYPTAGVLIPLGNAGGFSGARLWRVRWDPGDLCVRAWPPGESSPDRLRFIHALMRKGREAGLEFVPAVLNTRTGARWVERASRLWDVTTWMRGRADFLTCPTPARLEAACAALARLHGAWSEAGATVGSCPGVQRRLEQAREWISLLGSGWQPAFGAVEDAEVRAWAERAWHWMRLRIVNVPHQLGPWIGRPVPLQPCLCDIWHDHVLFDGDAVTGVIDFGSVKMDHVAVDLARLLGSLAQEDAARWAAGLRFYRRWHPLTSEEEALTGLLDETGTLLGAANWLKWLYRDHRKYEDPQAVARRLAALVRRWEMLEAHGPFPVGFAEDP